MGTGQTARNCVHGTLGHFLIAKYLAFKCLLKIRLTIRIPDLLARLFIWRNLHSHCIIVGFDEIDTMRCQCGREGFGAKWLYGFPTPGGTIS